MSRTLASDFAAEKDQTWARPFLSAIFHFGGSVGDIFAADLDITIGANAHKGIVSRWGEFQSVIRPRDGSFQIGSMQVEITNFPVFGSPAKRFSDLWPGLGIEAVEVDLYQNFLAVADSSKIMQDLVHVFTMRPIDYSPDAVRVELVSVSEKYLDKKEISFAISKSDFPAADIDALGARAHVIYGSPKGVPAQLVAAYPGSALRAAIDETKLNIPVFQEFYDLISVAGSRLNMTANHKVTLASATDANSYATSSITPGANKLVLAWIVNTHGSAATLPTLTGNGLTWVQVDTQLFSANTARLTLFRAMGAAPTAGAVTIDFGGVTQTGAGWSISEIDNADRSGTNGSGAIVQVAKNTATAANALTVTAAAFDYEENWTIAGTGITTNPVLTIGAGFTELAKDGAAGGPKIQSQYKKEADISADWSFDAAVDCAGIAVEIRMAEVGAVQIGAEKIQFTSKRQNVASANHLVTLQSTANASSYDTASITPGANKLVLAWIENSAATPGTPTLSGNGLTWVQVATLLFDSLGRRLTLFRAMGAAPSAGAVTIDFSGATQTGCGWSIVEFGDVDTSGSHGSGAIVQIATGSSTSPLTITLAAFASADNATAAGYAKDTTGAFTPGEGFSIIGTDSNTLPDARIMSQWKDTADTSVDASFASGAASGIAVEIKAAGGLSLSGATRGADGTTAETHSANARMYYFPPSITYLAAGHPMKSLDAVYVRSGDDVTKIDPARVKSNLADTALISGKTVTSLRFNVPPLTTERWMEQIGSYDGATPGIVTFPEQARLKSSGLFEYTIEYEIDMSTAGASEVVTITRDGGPVNVMELLVMSSGTILLRGDAPLVFYDTIYYAGAAGNRLEIGHTGITIDVTSVKVRYKVRARLDDPLDSLATSRTLTHKQFARTLSFATVSGQASNSVVLDLGGQEHPRSGGKFHYKIAWFGYGDLVSIEIFIKRHLTSATEAYVLLWASNGAGAKIGNFTSEWDDDHFHNSSATRRLEFVVRKIGTFASSGELVVSASVEYQIANPARGADTDHLLKESTADLIVGGEVLFDGQGYADDGSGTYTGSANALIEKPADVEHHLARVVGAIPSNRVDAASFAQARTDSPSSYRFAGVVTERSFILKEILLALGMQSRIKPDFPIDKLTARFLKSSYSAPSKTIKADNTEPGSLRLRRGAVEDVINKIDLRYGRRWSESRGQNAFTGLAPASDSTSITKYGERQQSERFLFDFVPDDNAAMATDLAAFYLARLKEPARIVELRSFLDQYELLVGDVRALDYIVGGAEKFDGLDGSQKFLAEEVAHVLGALANGEMRLMRLIFREVA